MSKVRGYLKTWSFRLGLSKAFWCIADFSGRGPNFSWEVFPSGYQKCVCNGVFIPALVCPVFLGQTLALS